MKIIIVGAGQVGGTLAENLAQDITKWNPNQLEIIHQIDVKKEQDIFFEHFLATIF